MASQELQVVPKPLDDEALHALVTTGNLASLTTTQQTQYYRYRCLQAGLDPSTKPFDVLTLNGKKILYATKECGAQLCSKHRLSAEIRSTKNDDGNYEVTARIISPDGRFTDDLGSVSVKGLSGEALSNAKMKATTKAKRRATLTHCGLGMMDESEVEGIHASWGGTGSREAQQESAKRTIAELEGRKYADAPISAEGGSGSAEAPLPPDDIADDPLDSPTQAPRGQGKASTRKSGASQGLTAKQIMFQDDLRPIKAAYLQVGDSAGYRAIVKAQGVEKSKDLDTPEKQQKFIKALRIATLELEMRACGAKLYTDPKWLALFPDEQAAIRAANFTYAVGRKAKNSQEQVDAICSEQVGRGFGAKDVMEWWTARNAEVDAKLKAQP